MLFVVWWLQLIYHIYSICISVLWNTTFTHIDIVQFPLLDGGKAFCRWEWKKLFEHNCRNHWFQLNFGCCKFTEILCRICSLGWCKWMEPPQAPTMNNFGERIQGSTTIWAFEMVHHFKAKSLGQIDADASVFSHTFTAYKWLVLRPETVCTDALHFCPSHGYFASERSQCGYEVDDYLAWRVNCTTMHFQLSEQRFYGLDNFNV